MAFKIKYCGPKDYKTYQGQRFPRLVAVEVPNTLATFLLSDPYSFLPADQDVPDDVLAQRDALPLAMEREGQERIEQYQMMKAQAMLLPHGNIVEETGKPDSVMQKRIDSMKGAQDEIDHGQALIDEAKKLRARIAAEKAIAAAGPDDEPEQGDEETPAAAKRRRKSEAVAI